MASVRDTNLDRGDARSVVLRDGSARLSLRPSSSASGVLDGAWWPRSTDPVVELIALSEALGVRRAPVRGIGLARPGWDSAPRRIRLASGDGLPWTGFGARCPPGADPRHRRSVDRSVTHPC